MATKPIIAEIGQLYREDTLAYQKKRYNRVIDLYRNSFSSDGGNIRLFSAPGRAEIGGNHTDHNCGKVLAASVDLDIIAVVEPTDEPFAVIRSEGHDEARINITELDVREEEKLTSTGILRGITRGFRDRGYAVGGFNAYTVSNVAKGSGLSSSAAFEVLIATIYSYLFNGGSIDRIKLAQIGQFAENRYFGKNGGLMDQTAASVGGFVAIDFKDIDSPIIENIGVDFDSFGHALCIIDTNSHSGDRIAEYAAILEEMHQIADYFSVNNLRQIVKQDIILNIKQYPAKMVVLTGGEPTLQITANLCRLIQQQGYYITIETNGTRSTIPNNHNDNTPVQLNEAVNWITCSPKAHSTTRLNKADELKIVLTDDTLPMLDEYRDNIKATHHFLQPCSNSNTGQVINYIKQHPTWRLSLQTHKLIGIQ